jgi:23S rRNA pseudouridine2604 synthase
LSPAKVSWQSETRLRFALKGEKPGQIAYFCENVGLRIEAMKRIRIGRVPMSGLAVGQWRYLLADERF